MGLDFSHTEAHWTYLHFSEFRKSLATFEGIDLPRMKGYVADGQPWETVTTPLVPLLDHSDCDGELTPDQCTQVAARLREVVEELWPAPSVHRENGLLLADGMDAAAQAGEPLEFC